MKKSCFIIHEKRYLFNKNGQAFVIFGLSIVAAMSKDVWMILCIERASLENENVAFQMSCHRVAVVRNVKDEVTFQVVESQIGYTREN